MLCALFLTIYINIIIVVIYLLICSMHFILLQSPQYHYNELLATFPFTHKYVASYIGSSIQYDQSND